MARILKPLLLGGSWGVGLGIAVGVATLAGPGLKPLAVEALKRYLETARKAGKTAFLERERLQDLYRGPVAESSAGGHAKRRATRQARGIGDAG